MAKKVKSYKLEDAVKVKIKPIQNRITMNLAVIHQPVGEQPKAVQGSGWSWLESAEEAWSRALTAGASYEQLINQHCWVKLPGMIVVQNLHGAGRQVNPTEAEVKDSAKRIIEVSELGVGTKLLIPPGWLFPILVADPSKLHIRCLHESAKYRVTIHPK
jgi:hypothetical protein